MTYSVRLFDGTDGEIIPNWWVNFVTHNRCYSGIETANEHLLDYSASFSCMKGPKDDWGTRYIDFYDEKAYVWFVLRWS